ncbi:MAG: ABC transporter ATP-binding protein [bacterium]
MPHAIEIEQLTKIFRPQTGIRRWFSSSSISHDIKVLDDVTLHVQAGEVFGLLGPNGAGKTTLLKVLSTLIRPDRGSVRILGYDLVRDEYRIKERVGMVYPDERSFYWRLSGRENLRFFGSLLNLSIREIDRRTRELSSLMNMDNFLDDRYDAYSTGMKQRLLVARAMLREPAVLLMDEPTRGLDPAMAESLLKQIRYLALNKQTTIVMVTHRLAEARNFCDRIGILDRGRLVCDGSIEDDLFQGHQQGGRVR